MRPFKQAESPENTRHLHAEVVALDQLELLRKRETSPSFALCPSVAAAGFAPSRLVARGALGQEASFGAVQLQACKKEGVRRNQNFRMDMNGSPCKRQQVHLRKGACLHQAFLIQITTPSESQRFCMCQDPAFSSRCFNRSFSRSSRSLARLKRLSLSPHLGGLVTPVACTP